MDGSATNWEIFFGVVASIGVVGTLLIAITTLLIARRQTDIAEATANLSRAAVELQQDQTANVERQTELAVSLTRLEKQRDTPIVIPTGARVTQGTSDPEFSFFLTNVGGGAAWRIHITAVIVMHFGEAGSNGRIDAPLIGMRVDFCAAEPSLVTLPSDSRFRVDGDVKEWLVAAVLGCYLTHDGPTEITYEILPGLIDQILENPLIREEHKSNLELISSAWQ